MDFPGPLLTVKSQQDPFLKRVQEEVQLFGHGGVGDGGVANLAVAKASEHGHLNGGDDLPRVLPEKGHPEDLLGVLVHDGLPAAGRQVQRLGSGDGRGRDLCDPDTPPQITSHPIAFGSGEWTCVIGEFEGGGRMRTVAKWHDGAIVEEYIWA